MSNPDVLKTIDSGGGVLRTEGIGHHHPIRVLVMAETYPLPDGRVRTSNYFHERNKYYKENGLEVKVLNFSVSECYTLDGICVISYSAWKKSEEKDNYDVLISHAPNIKHHLPFLLGNEHRFKYILFFFHGQEVLKINEIYPKPYSFQKQDAIKVVARNVYDSFKLSVWKYYLPQLRKKSDYIFVSNSLKEQFFDGTKIRNSLIEEKCHVISNGIGKEFESVRFDVCSEKEFDFITIRSNMDSSTYCIDVLCKLAEKYQEYTFLLIGAGRFFDYYEKPENLTIINATLSHAELIKKLQISRVALMLTKNDTQGVMSCEIASTGMPLITSDIKVCREVFSCFENVKLVENNANRINLVKIIEELESGLPYEKVRNYYSENTVNKEYDLIKKLFRDEP